ncbi:MAG: hypothetical protein JXR95_07140 [Deltaproteobacteria bacterium]|nr:hypothetical protein [Deltaproteobacteria bacterium]
MKKYIPLTALLFFISVPVQSWAQKLDYRTSFRGGYSFNLNSAMDDGVSTNGPAFGATGEFKFDFQLFTLRTGIFADISVYPGIAWTLQTGAIAQYVRTVHFIDRDFEIAGGYGFSAVIAPTRDAGFTYTGSTVKVDLRTEVSEDFSAGFYIRYDQIHMGEFKDPKFLGFGIEVTWGKSINKPVVKFAEPKSTAKKLTPVKNSKPGNTSGNSVKPNDNTQNNNISPDDTDGDGVKNSIDKCPTSRMGEKVDEKGCKSVHDGMKFKDLVFESGKSLISNKAEVEIKRLSEILQANPEIHVVIVVRDKDQTLASKKADVIEYKLKEMKISSDRIKIDAKAGEKEDVYFNFLLGI